MLKFVSRKPPKGKSGAEEPVPTKPFQQTRPAFRPRAFSNQRSPSSFEPYTRGDKSYIHRSPKLGGRETTPTKYADVPGEDLEGIYDNLSKMRNKINEMYENGHDRSIDSEHNRSRSPSNISTESSSHGSFHQKNYHGIFHDPRRTGSYRHVTWSPDVTNGDSLQTLEKRSLSFSGGNRDRVLPEATNVGHVTSNGRSHSFSGRPQNSSDLETDGPDNGPLYSKPYPVRSDVVQATSQHSPGITSPRTVNVAQKFKGDHSGQTTSQQRHFGSSSTPHTSNQSHNLSDSQISFHGNTSYPDKMDFTSFGSSPIVASKPMEPNYAYYTTLPANFSMRSNFIFSPRTCSTPVKDVFPHTETMSRQHAPLPRDQKHRKYPDQPFLGHMTKISPSKETVNVLKEGEDEYDNLKPFDDDSYKESNKNSRHKESCIKQQLVSSDARPSHINRGFPRLNYSGQENVIDKAPSVLVADRPKENISQMADNNPLRKVRRGFPRLFLPREKKKVVSQNSPVVFDHVSSSTSGPGPGFPHDTVDRGPQLSTRIGDHGIMAHQSSAVGVVSPGVVSPPWLVDKPTVTKQQSVFDSQNFYLRDHQSEGQGHHWSQGQHSPQTVMTSCVPQVNHEVRHDSVNKYQFSPREPLISGSSTPGAKMSTMRDMLNRSQDQVEDDQLVLDLVYITERIISMSFPSDGHEATYRYNLKEVMTMLRTKHGDNCLVLNLSETRPDLQKLSPKHVMDYGWPDFLAPPLERLCNICKAMDSWLNSDPNHVVVIHCKGSNSRIALIIAAFMNYSSICASADQALDRFAMKRFYDDKLGGITHPSQLRYVEYFYGLLSGSIKINSNPLYLHHIVIHGVPNFDTKGGCRPFIKVYQGMQPIFTSGVYNVTDQMQKVCISISPGIPLRGDIMINCFHKKTKTAVQESVWSCQFHTCAISGFNLVFAKKDLDDARIDPRFPDQGKVEFVFGSSQDSQVKVSDFKSDVTVPVDDNDNIDQWDSLQNYTNANRENRTVDDVNINGSPMGAGRAPQQMTLATTHSSGPVDGSLYATVTKRKHEQSSSGHTIMQNGVTTMTSHDHVTQQQNGSHTSSVDSGISASSGIVGNTSTSMSSSMNISPQYSAGVHSEPTQRSYSSTINSTKSGYTNTSASSSVPKKSVPPLDEQTQLDMILSDLLNDQVFVSSPTSPKSGATTSSKETRTFRTYDTQLSPEGKTTYQTAEVTYKIPGGYKEERNYSMSKTAESKSYVPTNAFSYTATSPELARKAESPKTHTLPYKTDYDNRYYSESSQNYRTMDSSGSLSPHDHTTTWLEQQQQKLRQRKDSKDEKTVQQERQLVEELKTAQNKYFTKRAANEAEEQATMESYRATSPPVANGPVSSPGSYNYTVTRTHTYNTERSPQDQINTSWSQGYNTGDSYSSYSSSRADKAKPPPSPGQTRATPPVTSPVTPPVRSSSKDYMQRTRTTSTSSWQGKVGREADVHPPVIRSISITTPPQSPRPFSPVHIQKVMAPPPPQQQPMFGVTSVTPSQSQQTIKTTVRTSTDDVQSRLSPTKTKVTEVQEISHPDGEKKSHYITEVYVHRTPGSTTQSTTLERKERAERETNKLEELEKSLQAASNSIMASSPWQQKSGPSGYSTTEHHVTRKVETRKYETHSQQQQQQQQHIQKMESVSSPEQPNRSMSPVWDNLQHDSIVTFDRGCKIKVESPDTDSGKEGNRPASTNEVLLGFVEANSAFNDLVSELSTSRGSSPSSLNLDSYVIDKNRLSDGRSSSTRGGRLSVESQGRKISDSSVKSGRLSVESQGRKVSDSSVKSGRHSVESQGRKISDSSQHLMSSSQQKEVNSSTSSVEKSSRELTLSSSSSSQERKTSQTSQELIVDKVSQERKLSNYENMQSNNYSKRSEIMEGNVVNIFGSQVRTSEEQEVHEPELSVAETGFQLHKFTDDYRKSWGFITDDHDLGQKVKDLSVSKEQVLLKDSNRITVINKSEDVKTGGKDTASIDVTKQIISVDRPQIVVNKQDSKNAGINAECKGSEVKVKQITGKVSENEKSLCSLSAQQLEVERQEYLVGLNKEQITENKRSKHSDAKGQGHQINGSFSEKQKVEVSSESRQDHSEFVQVDSLTENRVEREINRNQSVRGAESVVGESNKVQHCRSVDRNEEVIESRQQQYQKSSGIDIGERKDETRVHSSRSQDYGSERGVSERSEVDWNVGINQNQHNFSFAKMDFSTMSTQSSFLESSEQSQMKSTTQVVKNQVQSAPPPPKQISVVEEDRITLRPIGPGMQPLEPEGVGTLGRATTPSFPVSPVASAEDYIRSVHNKIRRMSLGSQQDLHATPPFPVSPGTPYSNQASTPGLSPGSASFDRDEAYNDMISRQLCRMSDPLYASIPEDVGGEKKVGSHGGMSSQQQQQQQQQQVQHSYQYQTQQHQEYQQQQGGTLQPNITPHGTVRAVTPQDFSYSQQSSRAISPQNGSHSFQESHSYQTNQQHINRSGMDGGHGLHIDTSPRMLSHGSTSRTPTSPPSPGSLNSLRQQLSVGGTMSPTSHSVTGQSSPSLYFGTSRRGSISSIADSEPAHITTPRFVRDTSKFWYKPHITREEAIALLKDKQPGSFVVRDSNSYPGAFGLALKVAQIPPNVQTKSTGDPAADLVRHFLVEPTHKGVRLRGSNNEPIFGSLASLVYQHSITPLSLPCKLSLPDAETIASMDMTSSMDGPHRADVPSSAAALLAQGAACNVLYICSIDTESLTGPQAVARAVKVIFDSQPLPKTTVVHFKVSNQGITLTDNQRKLFFRRHYPVAAVTYCGMDPEGRKFKRETDVPNVTADARMFGFVARKSGGASDNACHLFAELDPEQPASAIVNFVTKIMIGHGKVKS